MPRSQIVDRNWTLPVVPGVESISIQCRSGREDFRLWSAEYSDGDRTVFYRTAVYSMLVQVREVIGISMGTVRCSFCLIDATTLALVPDGIKVSKGRPASFALHQDNRDKVWVGATPSFQFGKVFSHHRSNGLRPFQIKLMLTFGHLARSCIAFSPPFFIKSKRLPGDVHLDEAWHRPMSVLQQGLPTLQPNTRLIDVPEDSDIEEVSLATSRTGLTYSERPMTSALDSVSYHSVAVSPYSRLDSRSSGFVTPAFRQGALRFAALPIQTGAVRFADSQILSEETHHAPSLAAGQQQSPPTEQRGRTPADHESCDYELPEAHDFTLSEWFHIQWAQMNRT